MVECGLTEHGRLPLASSEPEARSLGSIRLKSTLQHRFSCSCDGNAQQPSKNKFNFRIKQEKQGIAETPIQNTTQSAGTTQSVRQQFTRTWIGVAFGRDPSSA